MTSVKRPVGGGLGTEQQPDCFRAEQQKAERTERGEERAATLTTLCAVKPPEARRFLSRSLFKRYGTHGSEEVSKTVGQLRAGKRSYITITIYTDKR